MSAPHSRLFESVANISVTGRRAKVGPETLELLFAPQGAMRRIAPSFLSAEADPSLRVLFCSAHTHDFSDWMPATPSENLFHAGDDRFMFWNTGAPAMFYALDRRTGAAIVWCAGDRFPAWECTRPALPIIKAALVATPWVPVHGAAVGRNGRAILMVGPGRSGKTTAALACARAGWDYAGDDFVLVSTRSPARVEPLYASARLRADMAGAFDDLLASRIEISTDDGDVRHELRLASRLPAGQFRGGDIAAILLPFRGGAQRPCITPARSAAAISPLLQTSGLLLPGWKSETTEKLMTLIGLAPIFTIDTGMDAAAIPDALAELLEAV